MGYKSAINPGAVNKDDDFIIVNTLTETEIESWHSQDAANKACRIINNKHTKKPYKVIERRN